MNTNYAIRLKDGTWLISATTYCTQCSGAFAPTTTFNTIEEAQEKLNKYKKYGIKSVEGATIYEITIKEI